ncbi:MAG: AEC family transporter [Christensenella sp.]
MLEILLKAVGLICIIVLGYVLKKVGFFKPKDYVLIAKITLNVTLPAAVITSFSQSNLDFSLIWLVVIGLACNLVMVGLGYLTARKRDNTTKAFYMINMSGYNIGCFALPFIQSFLGAGGVVAACMFDAGNATMCTGGTYALAQGVDGTGNGGGFKRAMKALFTSVPLLVYISMFALSAVNVRLPDFVIDVASVIGAANAFMAMLMIGMMFEITPKKEYMKDAAQVLLWRYSMAAVFAVLIWFFAPFTAEVRQVLVILVFGPIAAMAPVFTEKCKGNVALSSMINSFAIIISTVCMTILLMVMNS